MARAVSDLEGQVSDYNAFRLAYLIKQAKSWDKMTPEQRRAWMAEAARRIR